MFHNTLSYTNIEPGENNMGNWIKRLLGIKSATVTDTVTTATSGINVAAEEVEVATTAVVAKRAPRVKKATTETTEPPVKKPRKPPAKKATTEA